MKNPKVDTHSLESNSGLKIARPTLYLTTTDMFVSCTTHKYVDFTFYAVKGIILMVQFKLLK